MTNFDLSIEAVLGANHLAQSAEPHAPPSCQMKDGQRIVGPEQESIVDLRKTTEVKQHPETVGLCERGDIGVERCISLRRFSQGQEKLFIEHEAIAAAMDGNDRDSLVKRQANPVGVSQ